MGKKGDKHTTQVYRSSIEKEIKNYITKLEKYQIPELKLGLIDDNIKQIRIRSLAQNIYFDKFLLLIKNNDDINEIKEKTLFIQTEAYMDYINNIINNYTKLESIIKEILVYDYLKMNYNELCFYRDNLKNFIKYYDKAIKYNIANYKKESIFEIAPNRIVVKKKNLEFLKKFFEKFPHYKSDYISMLNNILSKITTSNEYKFHTSLYNIFRSEFIEKILYYLNDGFIKLKKPQEQDLIDFKDSLCYLEGKFSFECERSYFIS